MNIYDKKHECMTRDDMEQLQLERLQATLNRVYQNVAFYKDSFDKSDINIEDIQSVADLSKLPFTTKDDLRKSYPYDMFAVPLRDIVRIHSTSGTTGKPIIVGYTINDIANWTGLIARVLTAIGLSDQDFVQIAFNYNLASAGLGFHYGAEKIGASVIPTSIDNVQNQISVMKDYKTSAIISTPGYALHMGMAIKELNLHPEELSLKTGLFGAEPWSEKMRDQIENSLHIKAYDNYGLTELIGPGISFECPFRKGLHINEDHFIPEIIDPKTLKNLGYGKDGELVFTTITKQGFPLIRYRTGDVSSLIEGKCECGRTLVRMNRLSGRTDDMIIIGGVNIFPSQIEEALLQVEGVEPHYQIVLDRKDGLETIEVQVEANESIPSFDEIGELQKLQKKLQKHLDTTLGISSKVTLVEPKTIKRSEGGKMRRVVDRREK
jgi:phenylacetate-CoA ligase